MSENGKLSKFWIQELTRPAFEDWLENEAEPVVIVGIGAIEQHGTHLPLGTDSLGVEKFIHDAASRTNSVCIHPCWPGYSPHHMSFKGSITFSEDTLLAILLDTIESLAEHGIKRIVLINFHGGNSNIMKLAAQIAKREFRVMIATPEGPRNTETSKKILERMQRYLEVHSGPRETAFALHYFPELVEMWRLDDWENGVVISEQLQEFMNPDREDYELVSQVFSACLGPNTEDITTTGQYATTDPRKADVKEAEVSMEEATQFLADFINVWKTIPVPLCYRD
ncbi:MAG: creatininase family protein [Candidatus Bathyarchaeota archaeon]|nr:creatininase family protein [Candidatus Bathyarchaeota archaeon]